MVSRFFGEAKEIVIYLRLNGFKMTFSKYKWKFALVIFFYYLVRDLLIYVVIPMSIWRLAN